MAFTINWGSAFDTSPSVGSDIGLGYQDINQTRQGIRERVGLDHEFDLSSSATQGAHKKGSARAYLQTNAPTVNEQSNIGSNTSDLHAGRMWVRDSTLIPAIQTFANGAVNGWSALTSQPREIEVTASPYAPTSADLTGLTYHRTNFDPGTDFVANFAANNPLANGAIAVFDNKTSYVCTLDIGTANVGIAAGEATMFLYAGAWHQVTGTPTTAIEGYTVDPTETAGTIPVRDANGALPGNLAGNANGAFYLYGNAGTTGPWDAVNAAADAAEAGKIPVYDAAVFSAQTDSKPTLHCDVNGYANQAFALQSGTNRWAPNASNAANTVVVRDANCNISGRLNGPILFGAEGGNIEASFGVNAPTMLLVNTSACVGGVWQTPAGMYCVGVVNGEANLCFASNTSRKVYLEDDQAVTVISNGGNVFFGDDNPTGATWLWYWRLA